MNKEKVKKVCIVVSKSTRSAKLKQELRLLTYLVDIGDFYSADILATRLVSTYSNYCNYTVFNLKRLLNLIKKIKQ